MVCSLGWKRTRNLVLATPSWTRRLWGWVWVGGGCGMVRRGGVDPWGMGVAGLLRAVVMVLASFGGAHAKAGEGHGLGAPPVAPPARVPPTRFMGGGACVSSARGRPKRRFWAWAATHNPLVLLASESAWRPRQAPPNCFWGEAPVEGPSRAFQVLVLLFQALFVETEGLSWVFSCFFLSIKSYPRPLLGLHVATPLWLCSMHTQTRTLTTHTFTPHSYSFHHAPACFPPFTIPCNHSASSLVLARPLGKKGPSLAACSAKSRLRASATTLAR